MAESARRADAHDGPGAGRQIGQLEHGLGEQTSAGGRERVAEGQAPAVRVHPVDRERAQASLDRAQNRLRLASKYKKG